ncbi:MAG: hypothetical protein ACREJ3_08085 [Polyangiaceae bacterium]
MPPPSKKAKKIRPPGAREFTVVVEEMRGQFKVFGEALQGLRGEVVSGFEEVHRRFEEVHRRFEHVDHELGLVKAAVIEHGRELRESRAELVKKVDREEVVVIATRILRDSTAH